MSAADDIAAVRECLMDDRRWSMQEALAALDRLSALLAATEADAKKAWEFEHKMMLRATAAEAREKALREALADCVFTWRGWVVGENTPIARARTLLAAASPEGER